MLPGHKAQPYFSCYTIGRGARALIAAVFLLLGGVLSSNTMVEGAEKLKATEYSLKAAFLCNFPEFVAWPGGAFTNETSPIIIGILGNDPFGDVLDEAAGKRSVHGRPLVVRRLKEAREIKECHVLFIAESETRRLADILAQLAGAPVLTVGDSDQFAHRGGMINLKTQERRIRFEVNLGAAERSNLKIKSQLLSLGIIVGNSPTGGK